MSKTVVQQLNDIYWKEEHWQSHSLTPADITNYHQWMIDKGNLQYYMEDGEVLGYWECWMITSEQLNRILTNEKFAAPLEDTQMGNIAYLANVWMVNDDRRKRTFKNLHDRFFAMINKCDFVTGKEIKRNSRLRIFTARR